MPEGLPSLWWSAEPKRRRIVMVAGVEKASCLSASTLSVWQPVPDVTSVAAYSRDNHSKI